MKSACNRIDTWLTLGIFLFYLLFPYPANAAAVITVTTTSDVVNVDGQCSLREAIIAANTDKSNGDCQAGNGADTINFSSTLPVPAVFTLTINGAAENNSASGDLDVTGSITILGSDQEQIIIDGSGFDRVFDVRPSANLIISGVTIQNGKTGTGESGAGILSVGRLSISDSSVSENAGDGIVNNAGLIILKNVMLRNNLGYGILNVGQGSLLFTAGDVSGNKMGGIYNTDATATLANLSVLNNTGAGGIANVGSAISRLTLTGSVVKFNSSDTNGGGIKNDGAQNIADIRNTTISSNRAVSAGGGIFNLGSLTLIGSTIDSNQGRTGAGVDHFGGVLSMTNDTVSANVAADNGGGLYNRNNATLVNVTFFGNSANGQDTGGNIFNDTASISIKNTIVANSKTGGNCFNSEGFINSQGHNLESEDTCNFKGSGDLVNTDPLIGVLGNNGGSTFTQALLTGSPAIDAGDNSGCSKTDQRGYSRPADGNGDGIAFCDIGAYEFNGFPPTPTLTATATVTPHSSITMTPTMTLDVTGTPVAQDTNTPTPVVTETLVETDTPTPELIYTETATPPIQVTVGSVTPTPIPSTIPPCSNAALILVGLFFLLMKLRAK